MIVLTFISQFNTVQTVQIGLLCTKTFQSLDTMSHITMLYYNIVCSNMIFIGIHDNNRSLIGTKSTVLSAAAALSGCNLAEPLPVLFWPN